MKLLLDSNIWLRFLVRDDEASYQECLRLVTYIEQGSIVPYISTIILLEIYWMLTSGYHVSKKDAQQDLDKICSIRGITIIEKTYFLKAFVLHKKTVVKLVDCIIATQLVDDILLCTYDREFKKIPGVKIVTPGQVTNSMA